MIINTNTITLADSGLELDNSIIVAIAFSGNNDKPDYSTIMVQLDFYASGEKFMSGISNGLNVEGFEKKKRKLMIEYPTTDRNIFLYFDQKIKEYLLQLFPDFDADKLVLTTEEIE